MKELPLGALHQRGAFVNCTLGITFLSDSQLPGVAPTILRF